jgi:hypothetical protein
MTEATQQPQGAESTDLTINDLNSIKVIIDIASSRGAFKPNEMVAVGTTYSKLEAFLTHVSKQQQAQQQPQQTTADEAVANTVAGV